MRKPPPPCDMTWRVKLTLNDGIIRVEPRCGYDPGTSIEGNYVRPPNWIGRMMGRTFEGNLQKACDRWQRVCDDRNAAQLRAAQVIATIDSN